MGSLVASIKSFQDAVDVFDTRAARHLSINGTDLRCLTLLQDCGPQLAHQLAQALGITKGATTTAIDRLAEAGYVKRRVNSADGRSFLIELTPFGQEEIATIWGPMRTAGRQLMAAYTERELRLLIRFFTDAIKLQTASVEALDAVAKDMTSKKGGSSEVATSQES